MPSTQWYLGTATAAAQVISLTPGGTIEAGDKFIVTLTDEAGGTQVESVSATGTTVAQTVTDLVTQLSASTKTLFAAVLWSNQTTFARGTARTAGVPIHAAVSTTESDNSPADAQTFALATTTPNSGPGDYNTAANWSGGSVPVTGDSIITDGRMAAAIAYGLDQTGVTLANWDDYRSRRFAIGTAAAALRFAGVTTGTTGTAPNDGGSGTGAFLNIHLGTAPTEYTVNATAAAGTGGLAPAVIGANNSANVLNVQGGTVWVSRFTASETGNFATINVTGGTVTIGPAVTLAAVNNHGGTVAIEKVSTSLVMTTTSGKTTLAGAAKAGTVNCDGGTTVISNRTTGADLGTLNMNGGAADFTAKPTAFAADTLNIHAGGSISLFSSSQATWTATTWDASDGTDLKVSVKA